MLRMRSSWLVVALAVCSVPGCGAQQQAPAAPAAVTTTASVAPGSPTSSVTAPAPVTTSALESTATSSPLATIAPAIARIVFIGKKNACECTQKAIDASTKALAARLGPTPVIPVERLEIDVDPDGVRKYQELRPMMALPALYFLDGKDQLVTMLQGEVSEAQLSGVLH